MTTDFLQPDGGWATANRVRIPPPPPPAKRGLLFRAMSHGSALLGRPDLPNIFPVLHIHPGLFWTWLLFASRLMPLGKLDTGIALEAPLEEELQALHRRLAEHSGSRLEITFRRHFMGR